MDRKIARRAFICQAATALGAASILPAEAKPITINGVPLIFDDTPDASPEDYINGLAGIAACKHVARYRDRFEGLSGPIWPRNPAKRMWCLSFILADTVLTYRVHYRSRDNNSDRFIANLLDCLSFERQALVDSLTTPDKAFA